MTAPIRAKLASILLLTGLTALNALEIAALKKGQILAVSGGAGLLAQYAIAAAKRQGIKVIADANPARSLSASASRGESRSTGTGRRVLYFSKASQ